MTDETARKARMRNVLATIFSLYTFLAAFSELLDLDRSTMGSALDMCLIFLISRSVVLSEESVRAYVLPKIFQVIERGPTNHIVRVALDKFELPALVVQKLVLCEIMKRNSCATSVKIGQDRLLLPESQYDHDRLHCFDTSIPMQSAEVQALAQRVLAWITTKKTLRAEEVKLLCMEAYKMLSALNDIQDQEKRVQATRAVVNKIATCTTTPAALLAWHLEESNPRSKAFVGQASVFFMDTLSWNDLNTHAKALGPSLGCDYLAKTRRLFLPVRVDNNAKLLTAQSEPIKTQNLADCTAGTLVLFQSKAATVQQLKDFSAKSVIYIVREKGTKVYKKSGSKKSPELLEQTVTIGEVGPLLDFKSLESSVVIKSAADSGQQMVPSTAVNDSNSSATVSEDWEEFVGDNF